MKIVTLQGGEIRTSRLGLGTASLHHLFSTRERQRLLSHASHHGIGYFDTAPLYGHGLAERELGRFIRGRRSDVAIVTKFGLWPQPVYRASIQLYYLRTALARLPGAPRMRAAHRNFDAQRLRGSVENSLKRLDTDYIDALVLHEQELSELVDPHALAHALQSLRAEEMRRENQPELLSWALDAAELADHYRTIERWVGVDQHPIDAQFLNMARHPAANLQWGRLAPRFSKWIPFRRRNLGTAWQTFFTNAKHITVLLNARLESWAHGAATDASEQNIDSVQLRDESGAPIQVRAGRFVIAAGALESACILQRLLQQAGRPADYPVGHYLHDHLSFRVGRVTLKQRKRFNRLFAPVFQGTTMRSLRLEVKYDAGHPARLVTGYGHFVAETDEQSGFALVRDTLRALQSRNIAQALRRLPRAVFALPEIAEIVVGRYVRRHLPFGASASVWLHVDLEQPPARENRVVAGGENAMEIDWDLRADPRPSLNAYRDAIMEFWRANRLDEVATLDFMDLDTPERLVANMYDIYHPAGTTRMATSPEQGVVDRDLKVFGFDNLHILSSGVFPSMGSANPTFTVMALALRLARHCGARDQ